MKAWGMIAASSKIVCWKLVVVLCRAGKMQKGRLGKSFLYYYAGGWCQHCSNESCVVVSFAAYCNRYVSTRGLEGWKMEAWGVAGIRLRLDFHEKAYFSRFSEWAETKFSHGDLVSGFETGHFLLAAL